MAYGDDVADGHVADLDEGAEGADEALGDEADLDDGTEVEKPVTSEVTPRLRVDASADVVGVGVEGDGDGLVPVMPPAKALNDLRRNGRAGTRVVNGWQRWEWLVGNDDGD